MKHWLKQARGWAVFGICFFVTLELASRIDQWVMYGAPILGVYTYDAALFATDEFGIRGKPYGRYEKWKLNAFGFRGDDITLEKQPNRLRVMCVGASETFGLYETVGHEWPRQLEQALSRQGQEVEVINAAIAGMSLPQRTRHLKNRLLPFRPDVVVLMVEYGSYAGLTKEKVQARRGQLAVIPDRTGIVEGLKSVRIVSRLKDIVLPRLPMFIRGMVTEAERAFRLRLIQRELGSSYKSFDHVEPFEVEAFRHDLQELSALARGAGVKLILVAPATWLSDQNLDGMLLSWPYLDRSWWTEAQAVLSPTAREFARQESLGFIDLSEVVRGNEQEWMTDMLHFNDEGAEQVALRIAKQVLVETK